MSNLLCFFFFFFNDTATTEIYTLSLHDALPISADAVRKRRARQDRDQLLLGRFGNDRQYAGGTFRTHRRSRSEEHTSELQSHSDLVCRLLLEKKKDTSGHQLMPPRPSCSSSTEA